MALLGWLKATFILGVPFGALGFLVYQAATTGPLGASFEEYRLGYEVNRSTDTIVDYYSVPWPPSEVVPKLEHELGTSTEGRAAFQKGVLAIELPDIYPGYMTEGMFGQAYPWTGSDFIVGLPPLPERETMIAWRTKIVVTTKNAGGTLTKIRRLLHL